MQALSPFDPFPPRHLTVPSALHLFGALEKGKYGWEGKPGWTSWTALEPLDLVL